MECGGGEIYLFSLGSDKRQAMTSGCCPPTGVCICVCACACVNKTLMGTSMTIYTFHLCELLKYA